MKTNKKWLIGLLILVALLVGLTIIVANMTHLQEEKDSENVIQAMYVPYDSAQSGSYVMVEVQYRTPFTVTMPDFIFDKDGNRITADQLQAGNILNIYGNNTMLESYPAQYPGVSRIEVAEVGSPEDVKEYQDIIDQLSGLSADSGDTKTDDIPTLDVEYRTDAAWVNATINNMSISWTVAGEDAPIIGTQYYVTAAEGNAQTIGAETELKLRWSMEPQDFTVTRMDASKLDDDDYLKEYPSGEPVEVKEAEEEVQGSVSPQKYWSIEKAEPGYIYMVQGNWEQGTVGYAFLTK